MTGPYDLPRDANSSAPAPNPTEGLPTGPYGVTASGAGPYREPATVSTDPPVRSVFASDVHQRLAAGHHAAPQVAGAHGTPNADVTRLDQQLGAARPEARRPQVVPRLGATDHPGSSVAAHQPPSVTVNKLDLSGPAAGASPPAFTAEPTGSAARRVATPSFENDYQARYGPRPGGLDPVVRMAPGDLAGPASNVQGVVPPSLAPRSPLGGGVTPPCRLAPGEERG